VTAAPLLEARGLTKSFGGALALDGVDLTVLPGEVHGLLGENGSGKSTLIKILAGYHVPDAGTLSVAGHDVRLPLRPGEYRELGFEFVHQDLGLVPSLSVAENLFLGEIAAPSNRYFLSWSRAARRARQVFDRYGLAIDPRARTEDVRAVERALLAIVRALEGLRAEAGDEQRPTLLVLDEPTVFLPQHEVALLFDFVRGIAARGSSVLFVSHDLDEVREITDRVTVLREFWGRFTLRVRIPRSIQKRARTKQVYCVSSRSFLFQAESAATARPKHPVPFMKVANSAMSCHTHVVPRSIILT